MSMDLKSYSDLARMMPKGRDMSNQEALKTSAKALGTYLTHTFMSEIMKNIKTSKLMGDDFAQDVYNSYLIQGISEKIAEKNGLGFEKIFNKNLKTTKNQSKENDHAPVDILI